MAKNYVPIGKFLKQIKREIILEPEIRYNLLGVKWYGKGVFVRESKLGKEIKAKKLFKVCSGDFIYNRLFAWKSSFAIIPKEFDGCLVSGEFPTFVKNSEDVNINFILQYILLPHNIKKIDKLSTGMSSVSRKRFKEKSFLSFPIPDLSLNEQEYISSKISRHHNFRLHLEHEIENQQSLLKRLRQAILQEAIEGKLTAEWRKKRMADLAQKTGKNLRELRELCENDPDYSAKALLEKIKTEKEKLTKNTKGTKKFKELSPISDDEKPFDLPDGWVWTNLSTCSINKDGYRIPVTKSERERREKIYDYYGASGVIDKIDGYTHEGRHLLIGEDGANLITRTTPIAFIADGKFWVNNHAHVLTTIDAISLDYLKIHINAIDLKPYVTGGFQPKLSQSNLNRILIAFPPLAEQKAIVEKVDSLMAKIDALEEQVKERKAQAEQLMQAVLREAFNGEK